MSLVELRKAGPSEAVSGGAMDRVVERRGLPWWTKWAAGGAALLLAVILFWLYAPRGDTQNIDTGKLTISTVRNGTFEDFIPLRARVTPLLTVYLDAIEGGRVEKVVTEDGQALAKGQLIVVLSNAELQLSVLARQTEVEQQINNMRSQELALQQTRLTNETAVLAAKLATEKAQRQYDREERLAARGFVAGKQFADTRDVVDYERRHLVVLRQGQRNDERLQASQLAQQRASTASL